LRKQHLLNSSFISGFIGADFRMRAETVAYNNGLIDNKNVIMLNSGGWKRRGGSEFLADVGGRGRLAPFAFDHDELYIVALVEGAALVFSINGTLVGNLTGAPWSADMVWELSIAQLANTMIVCHESFAPQKILRTGLESFTLSAMSFESSITGDKTYQPFGRYVSSTCTLSCSHASGSGRTLTASEAIFSASWVGLRLRWYDTEMLITGYTSTTVVTVTIYGTLTGKFDTDPALTTNGSTTVEMTLAYHGLTSGQTLTIAGMNDVGGIAASNLNGARVCTNVDDHHFTFPGGTQASSSVDGGGPHATFSGAGIATRNWKEQAFSSVNGYPRCVCFYGGRLWFAGTPSDPGGIWASQLHGRFYNFDVGDGFDDEAIDLSIGSQVDGTAQQVAEIVHLVPDRDLNIYTATGEYYAPQPQDSALTPSTFRLKFQTGYGSASMRPVNFDGATLFAQRNARVIREFLFVDLSNSYQAPSVSFIAPELQTGPRQVMALNGHEARPEQYAFFVQDDGTVAVFLSSRSEKITSWSYWTADNVDGDAGFESVVTVGGKLYALVNRNGSYCLEAFQIDDNGVTVDCASTYSGAQQTDWVVDEVYWDQTVVLMEGNLYLGTAYVDSSGNVSTPIPVDNLIIGFDYAMRVETTSPRVDLPDGSHIGSIRRINKTIVDFKDTLNCVVNGREIIVRDALADLTEEPDPITEKRTITHFGFGRDPTVVFTTSAPQKCCVRGMKLEVTL
jgi:hypothetical protein